MSMPAAPANTRQLGAWWKYVEDLSIDQLEADRAQLWHQVKTGTDLRDQLNAEAAIEVIDAELESRA
jgi:hypothetical protein